jgi:hypothetical protein
VKHNIALQGPEFIFYEIPILYTAHCFDESVTTKLGMHSGNIIIVLSLEEVASNWISKIILLCKSLDGEIRARISGPKIRDRRNPKHHSYQQLATV